MPTVSKPRKKGNRWEINFIDAAGKRRFKTFRTKTEANAAIHHYNSDAQKIRAGVIAAPPEAHSFDELADYWIEKKAPRKRSGKDDQSIIRKHLRPYFGGIDLVMVGTELVDQFIIDKDGEVADKTLHNILTLLGTMLKLAQRLKWLAVLPQIDKPRLQDPDYQWFQTGSEIRRFLAAAKEESEMVFVLFCSAVYTGMRVGELLGLRWEDVSFDRRLITVKRSYSNPYTKNRGLRHVPILDPLLPVLRNWRLKQPGALLFPTREGTSRQPSDRLVSKIYKEVRERAGVPKIRFHDLRHTFASHWVLNGGDIFRLMKILGHREIRSTMRYAHLAPEAFGEDYGRLPDLLPSGASVASLEERRLGEGR